MNGYLSTEALMRTRYYHCWKPSSLLSSHLLNQDGSKWERPQSGWEINEAIKICYFEYI